MGGGRYGIIKGNRHNKEINSHIDFFVGPNGGVLTAKHKHWIGVSKRTSLLRKAKNKKLRNVINQMFREGSFIGDGGTASALIFEKRTGTKEDSFTDSNPSKLGSECQLLSLPIKFLAFS